MRSNVSDRDSRPLPTAYSMNYELIHEMKLSSVELLLNENSYFSTQKYWKLRNKHKLYYLVKWNNTNSVNITILPLGTRLIRFKVCIVCYTNLSLIPISTSSVRSAQLKSFKLRESRDTVAFVNIGTISWHATNNATKTIASHGKTWPTCFFLNIGLGYYLNSSYIGLLYHTHASFKINERPSNYKHTTMFVIENI